MFNLKDFYMEKLTSNLEVIYDQKRNKIIEQFFLLSQQFKKLKHGRSTLSEFNFLEYSASLDKEIVVYRARELYALSLSGIYLHGICSQHFDKTNSAIFFITKDYKLNINNHSLFSILDFINGIKFSNENYEFIFKPENHKKQSFTHYIDYKDQLLIKEDDLSIDKVYSIGYYEKTTNFKIYFDNKKIFNYDYILVDLHDGIQLSIQKDSDYIIGLRLAGETPLLIKTKDFKKYVIEEMSIIFNYNEIENTIEQIILTYDNYQLERYKPFIKQLFEYREEIEDKFLNIFNVKNVSTKDYIDIKKMVSIH